MWLRLFRLLGRLPLAWLHCVGGFIGLMVYQLVPGYRRRLREHLRLAVGSDRLAAESAAHAGRMALELPLLWQAERAPWVFEHLSVRGGDLLLDALARGRGALCLTPHLGAFELTARWLAAQGRPITVLYRPPKQRHWRSIVETLRPRPNLHTAPADLSGVRQMLRALKRGEAVGILPDQVPDRGEGIVLPFFGRPALTMTLPARLALASGAPVFLAAALRRPRGQGYDLRIEPLAAPLPDEPGAATAVLADAIERLILSAPQQYLWAYNRYKHVPPQAGGDGDAGVQR